MSLYLPLFRYFYFQETASPHAAMPAWMHDTWAMFCHSTQGIQMFIQLNQMGVPTTLILPKLAPISLCLV